jgi:hypothetical protein
MIFQGCGCGLHFHYFENWYLFVWELGSAAPPEKIWYRRVTLGENSPKSSAAIYACWNAPTAARSVSGLDGMLVECKFDDPSRN